MYTALLLLGFCTQGLSDVNRKEANTNTIVCVECFMLNNIDLRMSYMVALFQNPAPWVAYCTAALFMIFIMCVSGGPSM
jgi:hypothetical protein